MTTLESVKAALGITGDYQDPTLTQYIDDVTGFIVDAGVSPSNITAGLIARGVADLWNYGAADGVLSSYFKQRVAQLTWR